MKYNILTYAFFILFISKSYSQDALGLSSDLYQYLIKNDDFNKDGILNQSEIDHICCLSLSNVKSIKGISKLRNLKFVTLELDTFGLDELFELEGIKKLTIRSKKKKRSFLLPANCKFLLELNELSISDCVFDIETYNIHNISTLYLSNCEVNANISKLLEIKSLTSLDISNSILKQDLKIEKINTSLKSLTLRANNLSEIPSSINNLKGLKSLSFSKSNIKNLPQSIGQLDSLDYLDLSENKFDSFPDILLELKLLKYLSLHNNKIKINLTKNISQLIHLENIPISTNFAKEIPDEIFKIRELNTLLLNNCNLKSIPEMVFNLSNLKTLQLDNNQITEISPNITKLINLTELVLSNNKISSLPKWMENFKNLEKLDLSHNQISSFDLSCNKMRNLETLNLDFNKLNEFPYRLVECNNLKHLTLNNNFISSVDRLKYGDFGKVDKIELTDNLINDVPYIQRKKINIGLKETEFDSSMSEPYNNINIVEAIITQNNDCALFTCHVLYRIKGNTSFKYKVKVLNSFCGMSNIDTCIVESDKSLDVNVDYIINGYKDIHETVHCFFSYWNINSPNNISSATCYFSRCVEYFVIADQMATYIKNKHSGNVKLIANNILYADGEFKNGIPLGQWNIYFAHKETPKMIKSKLIFENGKLHGEVVKFVYENGKLQKKLLESYTNGKLQKSEEFKYNNDSLYRIEGSKYAIQYPFQNTYSYTIEPDRFDTIRTSMYRNIIYNDSSINDDFLTFPSFPHGIRQSIHNNKLITFGEYFLGKKVGVWYSDKACCTDTIAIYERTKSKSNVVAYHIGGKPMIEGSIINHKKEGTWKVYDEYGQLKKSISFENDILNGNSNFYDSNSITKRTYLDGKFISEEVTPK